MHKEREATTSIPFDKEERVFLLEKSGFNVLLQIEALKDAETIDEFLQKTESDLKGFHYEFLVREPVLRHTYEIKELEGRQRITSPKYAGVPLDDVTSSIEREGAVKRGIDTLVAYLPEAPIGSLFTLTSPSGWSGVQNEEGQELEFPESQTYLYRKISDTQIEAITLRSSMTLPEHERLLGIVPDENQTLRERIKAVASTVRYTPPGEDSTFEATATKISQIMGSESIWFDQDKTHTLADMLMSIERRFDQDTIGANVEAAINDYKDFVRKNITDTTPQSIKIAAIELGKTVMRISYEHRQSTHNNNEPKPNFTDNFYRSEASYVESLTGCTAFETTGSSIIDSPFGPRSAIVIENGKRILECFCPLCDKYKTKGKIKAEIAGGRIHCPLCHASASYKC